MSFKFKYLILNSFLLIYSCSTNNVFDENEVIKLYLEIKNDNNLDSELSEQILLDFFKEVSIFDLKKGKTFEREILFEDYNCDCIDRISILYNKSTSRIELNVYEEFFEKDLDWCPETSFMFSFKLEKNNITDIKLEFIAG